MGEFHGAVSALVEAFSHGISIIGTQRGRRKKQQLAIDLQTKTAEENLNRCLKKNKSDVKSAYGKDLARIGPGFASGDAEAHSCLSAILFRLNAGFVSVIERFTRGRSSSADYQVLLNLSNASRLEAINTFEQLSHRLSRSSLALVHIPEKQPARKSAHSSHKKSTLVNRPKHSRSKSAPELTVAPTPLGPASPDGWVRPKNGRKSSSSSTRSSTPKRSSPKTPQAPPLPPPKKSIQSQAPARTTPTPQIQAHTPSHQIQIRPTPSPLSSSRRDKRKSIMSFASDSTKLGEIPEHKWARPAQYDEKGGFEIRTYYPLEPYQEPERKKGMFGRLFRR